MSLFTLVVVVSYFLGSIPFGYLAGRLAGMDIRKVGSGNIGATNVVRVLGKRYGYPVFASDFAKGLAAVAFSTMAARAAQPRWASPETFGIFAAVSAVVGHSFPVWLKFRGGKGVAVSAGALFGLMPLAALVGVAIWVLVFFTTRYVSAASILAAMALPFVIWITARADESRGEALFYASLCLAAFVIWRHRSNVCRLIQGSEARFTRK
ncbi:MAG TPA: glycerol-3-phosphate 1-O-acyltransferase PlsY [Candidatus Udaeobacter sp.]|jgi:glycerol-3-phosphate acyltransferase PlsY|nr:glycerol-3-phosphate 1-O-acyltransferase PlsY [Candidatus Udaeobacter sp.]